MNLRRVTPWIVSAVMLWTTAGATPARAAGVVGTGSPESCTEAAFAAALATGGGVSFDCGPATHTIEITLAKEITVPTLIDGEGKIILDALGGNRLFNVYSGLTLRNLQLTNGYVAGSDGGAILHLPAKAEDALVLENTQIFNSESTDNGGAIATYGETTLTDSLLEANAAPNGGAIFARGGAAAVRLYSSYLYFNHATGAGDDGLGGGLLLFEGATGYMESGLIYSNTARLGGGVYLAANGSLWTEVQAQINDNRADVGGGIYAAANATLLLNNATLSENQAGAGGGVWTSAQATLANVTLSDNRAGEGGGLRSYGGGLTLTDVTFDGNRATLGGGFYNQGDATLTNATLNDNLAGALGGGVYNFAGTMHLTRVTFSANVSDDPLGAGGGLFNNQYGTMVLTDTVFSGNFAEANGGGLHNEFGKVTLNRAAFSGNWTQENGGALSNFGGLVSLSNATVSGNKSGQGGALFVGGTTHLNNVTLADNTATFHGGGVYNAGTLTLGNVSLSGNSAAHDGGGLYNDEGATALLSYVTLSDNSAGDNGGGIRQDGESLVVVDVTLSGNSAGDSGGGLYNATSAVLLGVTLSGNEALRGGGLYNEAGTTFADNTTFSGNTADLGGGLYNFEGAANLTNVTLYGNAAENLGGGIYLDGGTVTAKFSIVADSPSGGNCSGPVTSSQYSMASDTSCGLLHQPNVLLGPLAYNGGPTRTHLPLAGSPAINYVAAGCPPPATDQRGASRPVGGKCDAGAVEAGAILPMLYLPLVVKH